MYKKLKEAMIDLGITSVELYEFLSYPNPKRFSERLSGKVKFIDDDKEDIYKYLKKRGYKGSIKNLFVYSLPVEKHKKETRLSKIINERMNYLNLSNKDVIKELNINKNTISGWRNGTIENIDNSNVLPLSKLLDIYPLYLMGDDKYKSFNYGDGFFKEEKEIKMYYSNLYDIFTKILLLEDSKYKLVEDRLLSKESKTLFVQKVFDEEIYPKVHSIFNKYFIDNCERIHIAKGKIEWEEK